MVLLIYTLPTIITPVVDSDESTCSSLSRSSFFSLPEIGSSASECSRIPSPSDDSSSLSLSRISLVVGIVFLLLIV
jgi:hypothetical protein